MAAVTQITEMMEGADGARFRMINELKEIEPKAKPKPKGRDILVMVYDRSEQLTSGGIIIPETNQEDRWQGKVGMVVALGPKCCEEMCPGYDAFFGGADETPKRGEWIVFNTRDSFDITMGKKAFRLVEWQYVRMAISAPDSVI